ncbi:MAG TPA: glucose 1-dehydrogenase [Acidimicrobiales bacterium]|jgi:3alpha(or 20beta)-hydroxysteroid dehydrogenase|nr:glucose 1-dehydrogenase [Acidimicrobiales bacterium]
MAGRLEGKVALISGAARGIGAASARLFVGEGAKVVVADVIDDEGELLAKELGDACAFVHLDVTDESQWLAAIEAAENQFGPVSVLVNNAGILRAIPLPLMSLEDYQSVIDVNQTGVFLGMKSVVGSMMKAGGGSIVNMSSIDGLQGSPALGAYVAAKFAVRGMTRVAALELAAAHIRVNTVCPGATRTTMMDAPDMAGIDIDALSCRMAPLARMGEAPEIAEAVLFLASDASSYCTGSDIVADGGATAGVGVEMFSLVEA